MTSYSGADEVSGSALVLRGDALRLPLADESVDLIVTSPPYFALRSYRDGDEHYAGQLGSEPTPQAFLEALWAVMHECWRVLKPTGSCFVNLGDKRSQRVATRMSSHQDGLFPGRPELVKDWKRDKALGLTRMPNQNTVAGSVNSHIREKSKMLLPHRFAIGCEDGLADPEGKGWIMRQDVVWQKLNGLPESVTDRVRDSHEWVFAMTKQDDAYGWPDEEPDDDKQMLFHFTKEGRYFAAVDEVREQYAPGTAERYAYACDTTGNRQDGTKGQGMMRAIANGEGGPTSTNPLGKLPGSVWALPSEPLIISDEVKAHYGLPDHFAAFPTELVRRVILGWSPSGVCTVCGEGRRPVVAKTPHKPKAFATVQQDSGRGWHGGDPDTRSLGTPAADRNATITGYACRCRFLRPPSTPAPTRPAVVLDIFGGTGTTAGVARALGRIGVSVDLSADYSRLADWRIHRSGHFAKAVNRTNRENQGSLL